MAADVMKAIEIVLAVETEEEWEASHLISYKISGLRETRAVCNEQPSFREDRAPFQLKHGGIPIP